MPDSESRKWPRWWDLDDWIAVAVLVPTSALLRRVRRLHHRPVRLVLSTLVVFAAVVVLVLALI